MNDVENLKDEVEKLFCKIVHDVGKKENVAELAGKEKIAAFFTK